MSKGSEDCLRAAAAAVVFTYVAQRWPKVGGPLLVIIVAQMLYTGVRRGYLPLPKRA